MFPLSNQRGESVFGFLHAQEAHSVSDSYLLSITQARANRLNNWLQANRYDVFVAQAMESKSRSEMRDKYKEAKNKIGKTIYDKHFS